MALNRIITKSVILSLLSIIIVFLSGALGAVKQISPDAIKSRLKIYDGAIINDSDTLFLDGLPLVRNRDYRIDYLEGIIYLNLSDSSGHGQLIVHYTPLPRWLKIYYGIAPETPRSDNRPVPISSHIQSPALPTVESGMLIRGTKRFSLFTRTEGASQFSQSLELAIKGELAPGLEISGSVTDKGYDPSYGTINSRINEFDKLYLQVRSQRFLAEIGNLEVQRPSPWGGNSAKQISGLQSKYVVRTFSTGVVFGRPRGIFRTAAFVGRDRIQGPYRITAGNDVAAIVPGSEKVWIDGALQERGADKDYTMDYPAAAITFTPRKLIDSRSRIEIDYEPLTTDYQREFYDLSAGVTISDSTLYFKAGFILEGDNKDRMKLGALSSGDQTMLQNIGDSTARNLRDGAVADSNGNYIERLDSLGNRYYVNVGGDSGAFRVSFTPVGSGGGDYLYEGGDSYRYVGMGRGDYMAMVRIPVPSREEYFETELGFRPSAVGRINIRMLQSRSDRNLYSTLNDNNNVGGEYIISALYGAAPVERANALGSELLLRIINKNLKSYLRRDRPDQVRKYLIPVGLSPSGDEREGRAALAATAPGPYNLRLETGLLNYSGQFNSYTGTVSLYPDSALSLLPILGYSRVLAEYDTSAANRKGDGEILSAEWKYDLRKETGFAASLKSDRRKNKYAGILRGTTEREGKLTIRYHGVTAEYQRFVQDTILTDWLRCLTRDRVVVNLNRRLGAWNGDVYLIGQWFRQNQSKERQFMSRLNFSYAPMKTDFSLNGSYSLSDENRFERGVRYIEVDPGQGKFVFRDGQYIPDPAGNFIEIEEIHSDQAAVKAGEKTLNLTYVPQNIYLRLSSNIQEELLEGGIRNALWILPFYSGNSLSYLSRHLNYAGELKFIKYSGYYLVNLAGSYNHEERRLGESIYLRWEKVFRAGLQESSGSWRYLQDGSYFEYRRDSYFSSPGNINGFKLSITAIRNLHQGQLNGGLFFRSARDGNNSRSKLYAIKINPRMRMVAGGETSLELEGYFQKLDERGFISYRLTDDYSGHRGINWSLRSDHKLEKDLRFTLTLSGRHANDRKARITGRGEVIASF
ncbi:MAG: hypothetical protein NT002_05635 [candidate division Zixibacteria bacterium]|nr:hypothetical protein [candidate division Zixibacteria bacterium]